jgi:mono/diheme cytochrome c family protein
MTRIVAIVLVLLTCGVVFALPPRICNTCPPVIHAQPAVVQVQHVVQEVVAPIAVPVLVPATVFQYLPALQPAAVAAVPAQAVAPQAPNIEQMVQERVDAALRARLGNDDRGPPPLILPNDFLSAAPPPPAAPEDLSQRVANMLAGQSCVNCHTAGEGRPVKGNVTLFAKKDNQLLFQPSVSKQQLVAAVIPNAQGKAAMPPNGPALTAAELDLLRRWEVQK